jgi:hypothetical protein
MDTEKATIERQWNNYSAPKIYKSSTIYNSIYKQALTTLTIDARANHVYFHLEEYRKETNRTANITISLTREEWNEYKKALLESNWGEL